MSGSSAAAAAWIFKVLAALGVLACVVLAARLARDRPYAAALVGWNPLLAIHFAGGGHNDALMIALMLGALALAGAGRRALAGVAWALADPRQVDPARLLRAAGDRGARDRPPGRPRRLRRWLRSSCGARDLALRLRLAARVRPARAERRGARRATRCRTGSSSSACRTRVALALAVAALAVGLAWLAREALRGRARLGLAAACCSRRRPGWRPGTRSGRCRSRPPRTTGARSCSRSASARTSCRRRSRSSSRDAGRRGRRPRRRRAATAGRAASCGERAVGPSGPRLSRNVSRRSSTTTHSASASTGKLKMRRRVREVRAERVRRADGRAVRARARARAGRRRRVASARASTRPSGPSRTPPRASAAATTTYASARRAGAAPKTVAARSAGDRDGRVVRLHGGLRDASTRAGSARAPAAPRARRAAPRAASSSERKQQRGEVAEVAAVERRASRSGSRTPTRPPARSGARRRAPRAARPSAASDGDPRRRSAARGGERRTRCPSPRRRARRAPSSRSRRREQRERPEPALVEVPPREEEQRARERDRMEVAHASATAPAGRAGRRGRARPPASPRRGACARARRPAARPRRRRPPGRRAAAPGSGQSHQSGASRARIGSKCEPSREICSPWTSVTESTSPCAVDQTACVMLPRSKRPLSKARCRSTAAVPKHGGEGGGGDPDDRERASRADEPLEETAPARAEHVLARLLAVGARGRPRRCCSASPDRPRAGAPPPRALRDRPAGRAARSRRRAAARAPPACRAVTSGVPHASAWKALFGITRPAFAEVPKTPSAQPARWISAGSRS